MSLLFILVLWVHLFSAIILVGGSFFIWLVVWPASFTITENEAERTRIVGRVAKRFAYFSHGTVTLLFLSGAYLAWPYVVAPGLALTTLRGEVLLAKVATVVVTIALMYANNLYHGRKIMRLAAQGRLDDVRRVRKLTHIASYVTLGLLLVITVLGATLVAL
ncbi:MAG: CopD family protein [Nitrososphaerota archaeon]|jgi:uncharacterized membrane protein|nr:CopD family protein [Nitrososphaerota archaeon]MDG6961493.1 CopD family protein [Nitrososphaerota archaeon]MDG7015229.1 CopD family protein [Nitrososphaerota archaeon]WGO49987.1 MAG: CopD family protein [Nitrososphaerota archaeon]